MILFVDDEKGAMDSYRRELELSGYSVEFKKNVDDALTFFKDNQSQINLLILDVMMSPGKAFQEEATEKGLRTGLRFFERIREARADLLVIILTNVSDPEVEEYFDKPKCKFCRKEYYDPDELVEEVQKFLPPRANDRSAL